MATISTTAANFSADVLGADKPVLVDFGRNGVGHAKRLGQP